MPDYSDILRLVAKEAKAQGADVELCKAIALVESNGNPLAVRFEPAWRWFVRPADYATALGINESTEKVLQAISWGPMQIMGTVAREMGYHGALVRLINPVEAIHYSVKKVLALMATYENESYLISAYNCGTPKKGPDGRFSNQDYVDKVSTRLDRLRKMV